MGALTPRIFWLYFCRVGGFDVMLSIFIYLLMAGETLLYAHLLGSSCTEEHHYRIQLYACKKKKKSMTKPNN